MKLSNHYSVFQAEVSAIQVAEKIIVDKNVLKRIITILSDSQAVIKALGSSVKSFRTVYDCRRCFNETTNRYEVCIII